ncbi:hypothetical protein ES708_27043 [subsurface metagenome]
MGKITSNEAIEILAKDRKDHHSFSTDIIGKAEALGIEALKHCQTCPYFEYQAKDELLPGETEE